MRKVFVTYGDDAYKYARKRIARQAKSLRLFDDFRIYSNHDLPQYIRTSPLMAFRRGGGYWVWKPYVIWKTMQDIEIGDVVFYADAGCVLSPSQDWQLYFDRLDSGYNGIVFQLQNKEYSWRYETKSPLLKYWTKQRVVEFFQRSDLRSDWLEQPQLLAGAFFLKKTERNAVVNDWFQIALLHPALFSDELAYERPAQISGFVNHRHDLSIFSILALLLREQERLLFMPETMEEPMDGAAIRTSRLRDEGAWWIRAARKMGRGLLGRRNAERVKAFLARISGAPGT